MRSFRPSITKAASRLTAAAVLLAPSAGYAAAVPAAPLLIYDLSFQPSAAAVPAARPTAEASPVAEPAGEAAAIDGDALECMAKVVHHESRGQPRKGQLAVAQTLINRLHAGSRFGGSICAVANQPGQFFNTRAYHPARDSTDWQTALDVSRETLDGSAETAAPGALFFHAAFRAPSGFFRTRQRVAAIGGQVFYR